MATLLLPYNVTVTQIDHGLNSVSGVGMEYMFTITLDNPDSPTGGGSVTLLLESGFTGTVTQAGAGYATGSDPNFTYTFNNKVYTLGGASVYFSAINDPMTWNNLNGDFNGFVTLSNAFSSQTNLVAMATFQGRLAFFSNYTIQLYIVDPNPVNWQQAQVLTNIGTFAPLSVSSLGELDVLFLNYNGVRSLRVRETTYNAYVNDIGSAIDQLVQAAIAQSGLTSAAAACSIVDPSTGRYWLFIPNAAASNGVGVIYVLSYYPSNKIIAWSTYDPSVMVNGVQTYFTPVKFILFNAQVLCVASDGNVYTFGGSTGVVYDTTPATVQLPFFDTGKPAHIKQAQAVDSDLSGTWTLYASEGWWSGASAAQQVIPIGEATFDKGSIPWESRGTHFTLKATCNTAEAAKITSLMLHYALGESPAN